MSEALRLQTNKVVKAGNFKRTQDDDSTISTKATASTSRKSTHKKGATFDKVEEEDNDKQEEEEGLPLLECPTHTLRIFQTLIHSYIFS